MTEINFFGEHGLITLQSQEYTVTKQGPLSGEWVLSLGENNLAQALKPYGLSRYFEVTDSEGLIIAQAESPFGRSYGLYQDDDLLGTIEPVHPFTRRATIDCHEKISELTQIFCF